MDNIRYAEISLYYIKEKFEEQTTLKSIILITNLQDYYDKKNGTLTARANGYEINTYKIYTKLPLFNKEKFKKEIDSYNISNLNKEEFKLRLRRIFDLSINIVHYYKEQLREIYLSKNKSRPGIS